MTSPRYNTTLLPLPLSENVAVGEHTTKLNRQKLYTTVIRYHTFLLNVNALSLLGRDIKPLLDVGWIKFPRRADEAPWYDQHICTIQAQAAQSMPTYTS